MKHITAGGILVSSLLTLLSSSGKGPGGILPPINHPLASPPGSCKSWRRAGGVMNAQQERAGDKKMGPKRKKSVFPIRRGLQLHKEEIQQGNKLNHCIRLKGGR